MLNNSLDNTIVAISTPIGEGGIGIVRISGPRSLAIADGIFIVADGKKPSEFKTFTTHYGYIIRGSGIGVRGSSEFRDSPRLDGNASLEDSPRPPNPEIIDEVILTVMRAPRSYTKEDIVEINCHGGIQAQREILDLVVAKGARIAEPGEFTKRAFLNGRIDLAQAEAVLDMIRAKTDSSLKAAAKQLEGGLSGEINIILDRLLSIASEIEASIDFPEEKPDIITQDLAKEADKILTALKRLIDTSGEGIILRDGALAVICGKPNAGKSSLMNLLLRRDRVIVTPIPGTTRDAVEETINLKGIPIRLVDTAGISDTGDALEKEGAKRSRTYLDDADMALVIFDGSTAIDADDLNIIKLVDKKRKLVIINKIDLPAKIDVNRLKCLTNPDAAVEISVERKWNIDILEKSIAEMVWSGGVYQGESPIVTNSRHKELLVKAFENMTAVKNGLCEEAHPELIAIDLKEAVSNLGLIVGRSVSDDILDRIFAEFCIGK